MYTLAQDFGILQMPMGASLHKLGGGGYEIIVGYTSSHCSTIILLYHRVDQAMKHHREVNLSYQQSVMLLFMMCVV